VGQTVFEFAADKTYKPIEIESDSWLGANVTLLPGVTIGQGCIVGAGSVVNKSLPPYTICVGVPCKPIKTRFNEADLQKHLQSISWNQLKAEDVIEQWNKSKINNK
jgi:acetyltransferase-like isoleucine patch superfamily enzyme